ncbi:MAG: hypothetical protein KA716_10885 [Gloeotrichia echinulata DEX184]|nr:hypothetical protein [Gloeotrichia echinulata DEX184]
MIIADINYLEVTTEEVVGGFNFTKTLSSTQNNNINFGNTSVIKEDTNINKKIKADSTIKGTSTLLLVDAEALGPNSLVEVEASNLSIAGQIASIGLKVVTAAN